MSASLASSRLIETADDLQNLARRLAREKHLAVDLEADSLFHYQEKICLLQLADTENCYLLDTLKITDCSPLGPLFEDPGIQKIFHGSDYDVRSLYRDYHITIRNLFDTELAARFLGRRETGLEAMLGMHFQVQLDKKFQRTDWSKRPLTPPMLEYGASDVAWLIPLARTLEENLAALGRLEWVLEENDWLSRVRPQPPYQGPWFLRFKGARQMDPRSLAVLERVLAFRQERAEARDRPVFKVLGADPIREVVEIKPQSLDQLKGIKGLSPKMIDRLGEGLIEAVRQGLAIPEGDLPRFPRSRKPPASAAVGLRVKMIKQWRENKALELQLEPGLLLNNALIDQVALLNPTRVEELDRIPELRNWQKQTFGEEIVQALGAPGQRPGKEN
ncbi:MAG: ribonuclease D [Deltaproteobacteria bacterium]|nr:ribonuclease D [Deltaproteobacteria bacterium]